MKTLSHALSEFVLEARVISRGFVALPSRSARAAIVDLPADATWSEVAPLGGLEIACERGTTWVTIEGDPADHVLVARERLATPANRRVAAMAFGPARIAVR